MCVLSPPFHHSEVTKPGVDTSKSGSMASSHAQNSIQTLGDGENAMEPTSAYLKGWCRFTISRLRNRKIPFYDFTVSTFKSIIHNRAAFWSRFPSSFS